MSEIRHYTVTQKRMVRVTANSPADAVLVAITAFKGDHHDRIGGTVIEPVREIDISAGEEI